MERKDLEALSREELIARAEAVGVVRPRSLTIPELIDDILSATQRGADRKRGWFGRARDLLTSVIDRGLAGEPRARRGDGRPAAPAPPPLPTVTLAEIYAAQGHLERAITTLDQVLAKEPGHSDAEGLRTRFREQLQKTKPSTPPPVMEAKLEPVPAVAEPSAPFLAGHEKFPLSDSAGKPGEFSRAEPTAEPSATAEPAPTPQQALDEPADSPVEAAETAFETDEIVALAVDPTTLYLYWEVRPESLARLRADHPTGALTVRAASVVASDGGARSDVRDVRVDALFGELFVHGIEPQANVRVSIGFKHDAGFAPIAVGVELSTPRRAPTTEVATTFRKMSDPPAPRAHEHAPAAGAAPRRDRDEVLLAKFPAGVWFDPKTRVIVHASVEGPADIAERALEGERELHLRPLGSSDLLRRTVVWASNPTA